MALPWLRILDAAIGIVDIARTRGTRAPIATDGADPQQQLEVGARTLGGLETRLAGVVVAALKEAFDRDTRRLELEREHLEAERQRAERALELERLRQAADREIGRLRQFAVVAAAGWIGSMFLSPRILGANAAAPRLLLGAAWVLLLASMAAAFAAQSSIARALEGDTDPSLSKPGGAMAPWFLVSGLALVGAAVLVS